MEDLKLAELAFEAQKNSYSPMSNFAVGCALLCKNDKVFFGANVENSSFGASNCAERSAIFSAISNGEKEFVKIAIVGGDNTEFITPCGICRQVISEFNPDLKIILAKKDAGKIELKTTTLKKLLPNAFKL